MRKESGQDLHPWDGAVKEERFLYPGKSCHRWGDQPGQRGSFRASEKNTATSLQQSEQRKTCIDSQYHSSALPSLRHLSASTSEGWVRKLGLQRSDPERGLGWAARKQPEGAGAWYNHT